MKTGYSTAGNSYKKDWEHVTGFFIVKTGKHWQVHCRMCSKQTNNSGDDHACKHKGCHVISRLHQKPDWQNSGQEDVSKNDVRPGCFGCDQREVHADNKCCKHTYKTKNNFLPAFKVCFLLDETEYSGKYDKQKRNASGSTIDIGGVG